MALRRSDLSFRRPPATGLLGHYPGRTHTGKSITALSGHTLLQNPWPGILPSPTPSGLGPLVPSRGFVSTRQSSISLRPAALFLLASPPGFRLTPEVDYRAPLAAYPGGTHTRWSRALSGQHKGGKTRSEFMRRAHTRGQPEMRMAAYCPPSTTATVAIAHRQLLWSPLRHPASSARSGPQPRRQRLRPNTSPRPSQGNPTAPVSPPPVPWSPILLLDHYQVTLRRRFLRP